MKLTIMEYVQDIKKNSLVRKVIGKHIFGVSSFKTILGHDASRNFTQTSFCFMLASVFDEDEYTGTRIDDQLEFLAEGDPDDNIPVSYPNTLVFNETYQNHLHGMLDTLQEALQENRKRQEEIEIELVELEQGRTLDYHRRHYEQDASVTGSSNLLPSNPLASNTRKATVSIFAAPYFKVRLILKDNSYICIHPVLIQQSYNVKNILSNL